MNPVLTSVKEGYGLYFMGLEVSTGMEGNNYGVGGYTAWTWWRVEALDGVGYLVRFINWRKLGSLLPFGVSRYRDEGGAFLE